MSETATEADGGYVCGDCGEELDDIVMVVEHDCSPVPISAPSLSRKERNTLLYIESRVVDHAGKLDMKQMNHTDQQNIKLFTAAGLLEVAQPEEFTHNPREDYEQVTMFSEAAWDIVRDCRQMRAAQDERIEFDVGDPPSAE